MTNTKQKRKSLEYTPPPPPPWAGLLNQVGGGHQRSYWETLYDKQQGTAPTEPHKTVQGGVNWHGVALSFDGYILVTLLLENPQLATASDEDLGRFRPGAVKPLGDALSELEGAGLLKIAQHEGKRYLAVQLPQGVTLQSVS